MPDPLTPDDDDEVTRLYVIGADGRPQAQPTPAPPLQEVPLLDIDEDETLVDEGALLDSDDDETLTNMEVVDDYALDDDAETNDANPVPAGPWRPGELVGVTINERYRIDKLIGLGGMGAVYRAHHVLIEKIVAVKVMNPAYSASEVDLERFLREARSASQIRHENVVDITDFGYSEGGQAFIVMEHLEGEDLATLLARERRIGWRRVVALALQICAGLKAAHARGIVHRDMKPDNCFIVKRDDGREQIKVLDFGIAKIVNERAEASLTGQALIGTPEYVAPELVLGEQADARVDIYALGVVMYEALTGAVPFKSETYMGTLQLHLRGELVPPSRAAADAEIPTGISDVVVRAMSRKPARRFQNIDELDLALRETCGLAPGGAFTLAGDAIVGEATVEEQLAGIQAPAVARLAAAPRRIDAQQRRLLMIVGPALGLALVALLWFAMGRGGEESTKGVPDEVAVVTPEAADPEPAKPPPETTAVEDGTGGADERAGEDESAGDEDESAGEEEDESAGEEEDESAGEEEDPSALPRSLSRGAFKRGLGGARARVKKSCSGLGLPGMKVTVKISVKPNGRVRSVTPVGSRAGSSLGRCVVKAAKRARFRKTEVGGTHTATFSL